ncbi:hypothetical protein L228DRAFT_152361 [Xylona heveae TC161]|uniref:Uncharacterized protein n=1 Tax=Xylona heveae (strain CBS 132557 / TC161) TaxID=1328760 RepID=A0A165GNU2_XYLHT|nr:hypothetical protein L228DRAFT_152361 [Xylona heveae TC161]KZF22415.1 hypothetical protein L228DRAFT_152361 [Xylona heveae TC161]
MKRGVSRGRHCWNRTWDTILRDRGLFELLDMQRLRFLRRWWGIYSFFFCFYLVYYSLLQSYFISQTVLL